MNPQTIKKTRFENLEPRNLLTKLADLDGDGDLDAYTQSAWFENADGRGEYVEYIFTDVKANAFAGADLDADGDLDIVTSEARWFENENGDFSKSHLLPYEGPIDRISVSDIGADGDQDLLFFAASQVVFLGNTDGVFALKDQLVVESILDAADFDGDNDIDVLKKVGQPNRGELQLLLNNGQNEFAVSYTLEDVYVEGGDEFEMANGTYTTSAAFVDMDGDGDLDLSRNGTDWDYDIYVDFISWIPNHQEQLAEEVRIADGCYFGISGIVGSLKTSDWDHDGDQDVWCYSNYDLFESGVSAIENVGGREFANEMIRYISYELVERGVEGFTDAGDINGDGFVDFVSSDIVDTAPVWLNGLTVDVYQTPQPAMIDPTPISIVANENLLDAEIIDLGDGTTWHAVTVGNNQVTVYQMDGAAAFATTQLQQFDIPGVKSVVSADVDVDGHKDLLIAVHGANRVLFSSGDGSYVDSQQRLGDEESNDIQVGDLDGDGDLDQLVANNGANHLWLNDGSGRFDRFDAGFGSGNTQSIAIIDKDNDGDLDVVSANLTVDRNDPDQRNQLWLNNGEGRFSNDTSRATIGGDQSNHVAAADLNDDLVPDLFISNTSTFDNSSQVLLAGREFWFATTLDSADSAASAIGDLDNDGDFDIVVANRSEQANTVWLNDGDGRFAPTYDALGSDASHSVSLADLDADGDLDILFVGDNGMSIHVNPTNPENPRENLLPPFPLPRVDDHGNSFEDATDQGRLEIGESTILTGRLNFENDVDVFSFSVRDGEHYVIETISGNVSLRMEDARGRWIRGEKLFFIERSDFKMYVNVQSGLGDYEIKVERFQEDHAPERGAATRVEVPSRTDGFIFSESDEDWFRFEPEVGVPYYLTAYHDTLPGSSFRIYETSGSSIVGSSSTDPINRLNFTYQPRDGRASNYLYVALEADCILRCQDISGTYTLEITTEKPDDVEFTIAGDSNHDGVFNSTDLVLVFQLGEFDDDINGNSTFESGDWNGDGDFDSGDFVYAFQKGQYSFEARRRDIQAAAVDLLFDDLDDRMLKNLEHQTIANLEIDSLNLQVRVN